ncbi:hypothetical protein BDR05DRAFT_997176 [Suillus weaverae]|nr:hypothetical protein BDR05DRAFT_997176 [Suillus weaverae]
MPAQMLLSAHTISHLLHDLLQMKIVYRNFIVSHAGPPHMLSSNIRLVRSLNIRKPDNMRMNLLPTSSTLIQLLLQSLSSVLSQVSSTPWVMGMEDRQSVNVLCFAMLKDILFHAATLKHLVQVFFSSSVDASHMSIQTVSRTDSNNPAIAADREIFEQTLALYTALYERGCPAIDSIDDNLAESVIDNSDGISADEYFNSAAFDDDSDGMDCLPSSRRVKKPRCGGKLIMQLDAYSQPFVRCKLRSHTRSLLDNDNIIISECEELAKSRGYGPLLPCSYVTSPSSQRQVCPHLHRQADGKLKQGVLRKWTHNCTAKFNIYVPHDLIACPCIIVLCSNPHSHPPPAPVKMPTPLVDIFHELLVLMKWKLADATPRRIYLDTAFIQGLHEVLGWDFPDGRDATLQDLHPSLANLDHDLKAGACLLAEEHAKLPLEQCYVRCVETHIIERGATLKLVICMTPCMSLHLMQATRLSIDTSFKCAQGWQEFEIESWNTEHQQSVVSSRAFTTSQSAKAHLILFERIFEIASTDTGLPVSFSHIHGCGFETVIADSHKGQGLGLGMYCAQLSRSITTPCPYESQCHLCDLGPYDHLRRFYRLCVAHFKRNVHGLHTHVSDKVYAAMLSLATSEPHPDIQKTLDIIHDGGPKAAAWLKDKLEGTKFAFPAIYQPARLIPLAFWKASPATTNGNEQSHRNAYREGIHLTLLAGLMKGMRYDQGATKSMDVHTAFGVSTRDQGATYIQRAKQCIMRQTRVQQKRHSSHTVITTQDAHPQPATARAVTMPTVQRARAKEPVVELPSFSLHKPPSPAQISTFSALSFALVSGARIIDYQPTTIQSLPLLTIADNSKCHIRVSSYM